MEVWRLTEAGSCEVLADRAADGNAVENGTLHVLWEIKVPIWCQDEGAATSHVHD